MNADSDIYQVITSLEKILPKCGKIGPEQHELQYKLIISFLRKLMKCESKTITGGKL